jgi:hypothetical protein
LSKHNCQCFYTVFHIFVFCFALACIDKAFRGSLSATILACILCCTLSFCSTIQSKYLYFVVFDKDWVIGGRPLRSSVSFAAYTTIWTTSQWSGVLWRTLLLETFSWKACNPFSSTKGSLPRFFPIFRISFSRNWRYFLYQS